MSRRELLGGIAAIALVAAGCTGDMYQQNRLKPMRESEHWADGRSVRDPVPGTVARGTLQQDPHFFTGKVDGKPATTFPFQITAPMLQRGRERFQIYCAPCHGLDGEGRGMVVRRGMRQPPSYHDLKLRQAPVGHFFDVMTKGFGVMYDFSYQLTPQDRWLVAAYIRALQLSQNAPAAELSPADRHRLEAAQ
jgi:mono/diheme cytochrome c family protein